MKKSEKKLLQICGCLTAHKKRSVLTCVRFQDTKGTTVIYFSQNKELSNSKASRTKDRGSHREALLSLGKAMSKVRPWPRPWEQPVQQGCSEPDAFVPALNSAERVCNKRDVRDLLFLFFFFFWWYSIIYLYPEQPRCNNKRRVWWPD